MEAITTPQFSALTIGSKSIGRNENIAMVALNLNRRGRKDCVITISRKPNIQSRSFHLGLPHSCNHSQAPLLESGDCYTSFDEDWLLKLIFSLQSEALQKLSFAPRKVVATGGGAVVRPVNWKYMRQGITVFLDVPLDALARRIAAVGTDSRPLLHFESGDAYTKAFVGLFTLTKKRSEAYANADATVSLLHLATNLRLEDVSDITPTVIAIEALAQIEKFLRGNNGKSLRMYPY
ncbi:shikimate kinase 1, chloroplastic [Quercus suber]|uniref:shikimate kinase 1, chloroplastic n=1 Tax=Quercus suber TaxID=58331 RepID=UPI0032DF3857